MLFLTKASSKIGKLFTKFLTYWYLVLSVVPMQPAKPSEEACLAGLMRLMDRIVLEENYDELKSKHYRDSVVEKTFRLIAGKDGNIDKVLFRWFNKAKYFKKFRLALIKKIEGLPP
jgi:hypothetical protein